jgi:hypothetical protein
VGDTVEDADDGPVVPGAPGVPPGPSVTPGSAPPPPPGSDPPAGKRGCLLVGAALGAFALVVLGGLVVLVGVAAGWFDGVGDAEKAERDIVAETGIETETPDVVRPPQRDVRLGACERSPEGEPRASGTLTNWSSDAADYRIELAFLDGDGSATSTEVGARTVEVAAVDSNATTNWSATAQVAAPDRLTCRIVRIDRWPSGEERPEGD